MCMGTIKGVYKLSIYTHIFELGCDMSSSWTICGGYFNLESPQGLFCDMAPDMII